MGKGMTIAGMVIAVLIFLLFALDLAIGIPFQRASRELDVLLSLSAAALAFLSWSTLKDFE